jgi:hypothetical protein
LGSRASQGTRTSPGTTPFGTNPLRTGPQNVGNVPTTGGPRIPPFNAPRRSGV